MVLPRGHKRSVSDQTGTMPFHNKQGGGSPRYAFRSKASSQGFSPLKSSGPKTKAKALKLPKHVPQTWNTNTNADAAVDAAGDEAPVKAFTPALKPLPGSAAELMKRIASEPLAPIADDDGDAGSTTAQASTVSEPPAERYITSTALATPASAATVSTAAGAAGAAAPVSATPAVPAPATGTGAASGGFTSYRRYAAMNAPMPTPPDEPAQNANGPPVVGPVAGPILNFYNVQRQPLSQPRMARSYDYWTRLTPDGATVEAPKLPGCGPWEIPLPPNMDTRVHVDNNVTLIFHYLKVHVTSKRWPPVLKIDLYPAQRLQETITPFVIEDQTAYRWRAWKIVFDWVEQLKIHGSAPANPPLDIITFIRNRAHQAGRLARDSALRAIESRQQGPMFGGLDVWQLPARTYVVCAPHDAAVARPNAARPNVAQDQAGKKPAPANNAGPNNAQKKQAVKKSAAPKAAAPKDAGSKTVAPKIEPGTAGTKRQGSVINIPSDSEDEEEEEQPQPKKRRQAK